MPMWIQEFLAMAIVFAAASAVAWRAAGPFLADLLAQRLLRRGQVKWAMRFRRLSGRRDCH